MPKKVKSAQYYESVGRRREAVARVRLFIPGKEKVVSVNGIKIKTGEIYVNKKPADATFSSIEDKNLLLFPLKLIGGTDRFAISILTRGGGKKGQLEASIHGLARALDKLDKDQYRINLKKHGLLTRDARTRERRKVGMGGKSRRAKQSPKR